MHLRSKTRRTAFTLIELLIVIAIIAILAALTFAVTTQTISRQRRNNTINFFQSLAKILNKQVTAVKEQAERERIPNTVLQMAGGSQARARVIWVKLRLKQNFPVTLDEARFPYKGWTKDAQGNKTAYLSATELPSLYVRSLGTATGGPESAICLYLALKRKRGGVSLSDDEVKPFVKQASNGLNMFVDGWGNPIGFYRFPFKNTHMHGTSPTPRDPFDRELLLFSASWPNNHAGKLAFQDLCHPLDPKEGSRYMIPTVASAGADELLGLGGYQVWEDAMTGVTPPGVAEDNIYGYLIRSGGKGQLGQ